MARIHLSKADITEVEERFVLDAMRSGWVAPLGPDVDAFEAELAARVGVPAALALSSGTAALHLALLAVGARPDTAVVVPTMTFAATANAVAYTGATPVFVDAQLADGNVDPALLVAAADALRADGIDVAAAMTVDLFGRCADYAAIEGPLAERGIPLVADAAESLGASYGGRQAGSFGSVAVLSFNGNKIMTTSGGGMLLSHDCDLVDRARHLATQARQPVPYYEHTEIGYNYRLSNLLAALGRGQLSRLDEMIARRRAIREQYVRGLADIPGVRFLGRDGAHGDAADNCWLTCVALDPAHTALSADTVVKSFSDVDIEARHLWKPMHLQPVFSGARAFVNGTSSELFAHGVALPSGSALREDEIARVVRAFREILGAA